MSNTPVVIVAGPTCTGKSTLANVVAKQLGATVLSQDQILSEIMPESDRNANDRMKSYDELFKRARAEFLSGNALVLEGTFSRHEYRAGLVRALPDAQFLIAELTVPLECALDRFSKRKGHPAIDQTADIVRDRNGDYPFSESALRIDGTQPVTDQAATLFNALLTGVRHDLMAWKDIGLKRSDLGRGL